MRIVGTLLVETCTELRERARAITAAHPGTPDDLFAIAAVAERIGEPLVADADFSGRIAAHPTGCAVCELEIDPLTGVVTVERYAQVDDVGQPINPLILDGQTHGGIAMGIGQTLYERCTSTCESGMVSGGTVHGIARAALVPRSELYVELRELRRAIRCA